MSLFGKKVSADVISMMRSSWIRGALKPTGLVFSQGEGNVNSRRGEETVNASVEAQAEGKRLKASRLKTAHSHHGQQGGNPHRVLPEILQHKTTLPNLHYSL